MLSSKRPPGLRRIALFGICLVGVGPAVASAATVPADGSAGAGGAPVVHAGAAWWLSQTGDQRRAGVVALRTRALAGGPVRSTPVVLPSPDVAPTGQDGSRPQSPRPVFGRLAFARGRAFLSVLWCGPEPEPVCTRGVAVAVDPATGAVVQVVPEYLAYGTGSTAYLAVPAGSHERLLDPLSRRVVGRRPMSSVTTIDSINGPYVLRLTGRGRWLSENLRSERGGAGRIAVLDLATGKQRFAVGAAAVARASARDHVRVENLQLQVDGSVAVQTRRTGGRTGLRPAWVDRRGRIRRLRHVVRSVAQVQAAVVRGRALVTTQNDGTSSSVCDATWVTDRSGTEGRRILRGVDIGDDFPGFWDGRAAVWGAGLVRARSPRAVVDAFEPQLGRARLTARDVPRCRP